MGQGITRDRPALLGGKPAVVDTLEYTWPPIHRADIERVTRLIEAGELSYYGREGEVALLEDGFKSLLGKRFALAVSSGTAALHSAYFALGLGPGDEVLAPSFTFLSTVMPIFVVNATPVLVDAEPDTSNIDPADIERKITPRTKAVVITHNWGHACDMEAILSIVDRHGLRLVEDCSHAHGATWNGQPLGSFGDVSIFSLQGSKLVAAGQGGILVSDDREIYERASLLGHFRMRAEQDVESESYAPFCSTGYGLNYRMHPLAAALANAQLERLDSYLVGRAQNLGHLSEQLRNVPGITPPVVKPYATRHAYYSYKPLYDGGALGDLPVEVYVAALRAEGVPINRSSSLPLHLEPLFQVDDDLSRSYGREDVFRDPAPRRRYRLGDLPVSERWASSALVLPPHTEPARATMDQYSEAFYKVAHYADELRQSAAILSKA